MTYANAQQVWNALNSTSDVEMMKDILRDSAADGIKLDFNDLVNFRDAQSVVIPEAKYTVLYGGYIIGPDGEKIFNSDIARLIAATDETAAVIDNSKAGELQFSQGFQEALKLSLDGDNDAFQRIYSGNVPALNADGSVQVNSSGETIYTRSTNLEIVTNSLGDTLSAKFVEANPHNYTVLSQNSNPFNTTNVTEIPLMLSMEDSVINNIPHDKIVQIRDYIIANGGTAADALNGEISAVLASARENSIQNIDVVLNPDGTPASVGTPTNPIPEGTPGKISFAELVPPLDIVNTTTFRIGSELLAKVGVGLVAVSAGVAVYDATVAYNAGNNALAAQILADWSTGTGGGLILGGVLGGAAAAGTEAWLTGLAALGGAEGVEALFVSMLAFGPPGEVAAGIVLIAATLFGVAGYIAGSESAQSLLHKLQELGFNALNNTAIFIEHLSQVWHDKHITLDKIEGTLTSAYHSFLDAVAAALIAPPTRSDPLVIDMNGNGIVLDSFAASNALFDLNGDGTPENTGWTKANSDDSFLVIDKNNNGNIDDITEMFGSATIPGFTELKKYDSNGDNLINSSDTQFNLLRLWNDANADGIVDSGEMTTLAASGITEISLNSYSRYVEIEGNLQTAISSVTVNGLARGIHELSFSFNTPTLDISTNPDLTLPADFHLNIESMVLPYSRGYRTLYSWQAAMTLDPTLLAMAQDMVQLKPADLYKINDKFEDFLFRWAGVENVTAAEVYATGSSSFDPRKVAFMEKITGADFLHINNASIASASKAWDLFFNDFLDRFLVQGNLHTLFPNASYDFATDTLNIGNSLDEVIANVNSFASTMDLNSFVNLAYYTKNIIELNKSQFDDVNFDAKVDGMLSNIIGAVDVAGFNFDGRLNIGSNYDDVLSGSAKNDVLNGLDGNDGLYGFAGNDYIVGGKGDDYLNGDAGNDIYRFSNGDGQDTIDDNAGVDKILLGDGITLADLSFAQVGSDIVINIGNSGDRIAIKNFYNAATNRIEKIVFNDGSSFNLQNLGAIVYGDDFVNTLNGTANNDIIYGLAGDDTISAGLGNDTITGGNGNDIIAGGNDDDTYIFNIGDGQDTITDSDGIDQLVFGPGIAQQDIQLISDYANNKSLIIKIGTNGDQIIINKFFYTNDTSFKIETFRFADGSTINLASGLALQATNPAGETLFGTYANDSLTGNIGNDIIFGSYGNDVITGGKGNDIIEGGYILNNTDNGSGNDTFIFNIGDGQDIITDFAGNDQIIFGAGITQSDIQLVSDYANNQSLIVKIGANGDQITIKNFFLVNYDIYKIETLKFADGSVMDLSHGLTLQGTNNAGETLSGTDFADNLTGADGNDTITSLDGNDTIAGGKGNDIINGLGGNDTYLFNIGDGQDIIAEYTGNDQIIFGTGITQEDIQLISDYDNNESLLIKIGVAGDQISLKNFFHSGDSTYKIETLKFADGSTIDLSHGLVLHGINVNGETISGTSSNDSLTGNIGNDSIMGLAGDDLITGGKGNDLLDGGSGDDTYIFNLGDGQDTIAGFPSTDQLVFGAGIVKEDIQLISDYANNQSLIIKVGTGGDQITLSKFFHSVDNTYKLGSLKFADGSVMDLLHGLTLQGTNITGETLQGTSSNDSLTGNIGNDDIFGSDGDDILTGGKGNDYIDNNSLFSGDDIYIFNKGDGQDIYFDYAGNDQIVFGAGISKEDILMEAAGNNLIIKFADSTDQITVNGFFVSNYKIETLKFNDGSTVNITNGLTVNGGAGDDAIIGTPFADTLYGAGGNDYIYGSDGDDNINGGIGNDILKGGNGSDIYSFDSGYGNDVIHEESGAGDKIIFGAGIESTGMAMIRSGNNLRISGQGNPDSLLIGDFFADDGNRVEYIQFSDGSKFNLANALASENDSTVYSVNGYVMVNEDVTSKIRLLNHNDGTADYNNISISGAAAHGSALVNANGDIIYTSSSNYNGADSFAISYVDAGGITQSKTINVDVLPVNDAPVALDKSIQTNEDTAIDIFPLAGANDIEDDTLIISSLGAAAHGTANIINDKIVYTPTANFYGNDAFSFTIADGNGGYDTKLINVNILPINDSPIAANDIANTTEENSVLINILGNDSDVEDGFFPASSITITTQPTNGTIAVQDTGKVFYTPNTDYYGQDSFQYTITDSGGLVSNASNVTINVVNVNDAPKFIIGSNINFTEDTQATFDVHDYFYDPDGDALSIVSVSAANGTMSFNGDNINYNPNANYNGVEKLTVTLRDSFGATSTLKADAMVAPVNDTPVAANDNFTVLEDAVTRLPILDNDSDIESGLFASSITNLTSPTHGTLQVNSSDGSISYTPAANYNGTDSFQYSVTDSGGLLSNVASVTIDVLPVNDAPVVAGVINTQIGTAGSAFSYTLPANAFSDVDGDALTYSAALGDGSALPAWLTFNPVTKTFAGTPPSGAALAIAVTASDGALSATQNFSLNITSNIITGTAGSDTLNGTAGDDIISGLAGNDIINGGAGNDLIDGGAGADAMDGGDGIDTVSYASSLLVVNVNLGITTSQGWGASGDTIKNVENLIGSAFGDYLYAANSGSTVSGGDGNDRIYGGSGNDILYGDAGNDTFYAGDGDDTIYGGDGNDIIYSQGGNNLLIGGAGKDSLNGFTGVATASYATSASAVNVNLAANINTGGDAEGDSIAGVNNLIGSDFDDILTGNLNANIINGGAGNDIIAGGAGADTINGGTGIDTISYAGYYNYYKLGLTVNLNLMGTAQASYGDASGDILSGIENVTGSIYNDTLTGNSGNNILTGGGGSDNYVFASNFGQDSINNISATGTAASGKVSFGSGISDENLWFQKVGSDLEVDLIGTDNSITIANWYGSNASAQVASFTAGGLKLDGQIAQLVSAMASYGASNPAFNPHTSTQMPTDTTLQAAIAASWHS